MSVHPRMGPARVVGEAHLHMHAMLVLELGPGTVAAQ